MLKEAGGYQDQIAAAFGGMNHIRFFGDDDFTVQPYPLMGAHRSEMLDRMILCYVPKTRLSSDVSVAKEIKKGSVIENLRFIRDAVDEGLKLLQGADFDGFGRLLHESWLRKRSFSGVTDDDIDDVYDRATSAGAIGGKLLGAGGGGFMLIWCQQGARSRVVAALAPMLVVPFDFDNDGSRIIYVGDSAGM
jgi:D-glycero-alpha-D-manno-heptose-7-phosphate kinase